MGPYVCKKHGHVEPYVTPRSGGQGGLRQCPVCRGDRAKAAYRNGIEKKKAYAAAYREANLDRLKKLGVLRARRAKWKVIAGYGGKCECCGEARFEFLTIEHRGGSGTARRRSGEDVGAGFLARLIREGFPATYGLLCMNCNLALGRFGHCPHRGPGVAPLSEIEAELSAVIADGADTRKTVAREKRCKRRVAVRGEILTIPIACEKYGVRHKTALYRLNHGWSDEEAFLAPPPVYPAQLSIT